MIKDLITKLQEEAAAEGEHKAWSHAGIGLQGSEHSKVCSQMYCTPDFRGV